MSYLQIYVSQKNQGNINVKAFNMIINRNEAKAMTEHISCNYKSKLNSTTYDSKQKWNNKHVHVNGKIIISLKKIIVGILAHVFVRIVSI